ncbi:MAG: 50S ribosomal protein L29 [Verrucomicrobiae bacterium]|nr:50S ribosomal protein L29 [Verrucomicrobiae bacterium]
MSDIITFSELTDSELAARHREFSKEIFHMRLQQQSGQLKKPSRIRDLRRDIARIETLLTQRRKGLKVTFRKKSSKESKKA